MNILTAGLQDSDKDISLNQKKEKEKKYKDLIHVRNRVTWAIPNGFLSMHYQIIYTVLFYFIFYYYVFKNN